MRQVSCTRLAHSPPAHDASHASSLPAHHHAHSSEQWATACQLAMVHRPQACASALQVQSRVRAGGLPLHKYIIRKQLTKRPEDYPDAQNQPHVQVAIRRKAAHKGSGILPVRPTSALTGRNCMCGALGTGVASPARSVPVCLLLACAHCPSRSPCTTPTGPHAGADIQA